MKIIDKTPLQDANGNVNIIARVQGTLKYGLSWFAELEAQKLVIAQLDRSLEKGFVLIRNFTLPNSEIIIPIILIGSGGIWVIYVTKEKGNFEAKGDQWNTVNNDGKALPASINLIDRVSKLTTAFQKYLKIQKVEMPNPVEAVLIAADPGAQIDSVRPIARVVRSDAIKQFATSLLQARPVWRTDFIHEIADRIIEARPPEELKPVVPAPAGQQTISRASALAEAAAQGNSFNPNELGFAFEESGAQAASQNSGESNPAQPRPQSKPAPTKKKFFGLSDTQVIILAGMFIIGCCVVFGLGIILYTYIYNLP
jgi:hypothetical protein